ncbi:KN motif and ankyrin repeat domain-containing protein 1b [Carassius gibelio]|uniref:KN motif and ankyrin repeat domain-containing protein 1b n=1 Tax=Carassius gibelio TaxID=101364 RepID=UPI002278F53C|nr:KN motif and ankyrin repeat domain-containing protein 1b [Carassius gibelio]
METCMCLEHEKGSLQQGPREPQPRRRLASFGGLGSTGTLSPYTSWSALNQGAKMTVLDQPRQGTLLLGSGLKISPLSSGQASPVSGVSPLHLQMVRDQMAAALRRLKDLEEQVKAIPVLQVKIAVLQEEKRQLTALVKSQEEAQKSSSSTDKDLQELTSKPEMEGWEHSAISSLTDFQQLSVEMQLLERKIQDARLESSAFKMRDRMCVAVGDDRRIDEVYVIHHHKSNFSKDVAVDTKLETQSVAVGVTETMLGVVSDKEAETELQQQTIQHLSDQVQILEAELKEAMLKAEMGRLRSELREAEARHRADKSSSAHPQVNCAATQTESQTRTLGVGNHTNLVHSAVGRGLEQISIDVGISCKPEMKVASSGPDTPMEEWEVRKRVEQKDQCVGSKSVSTHSQGVGMTVCVCDAATITSETLENKRSISRQTVGCGDCTVDMDVRSVKSLISQGTVTDPVRSVDLGVMAIPQTMSQRTNTAFCTVSRSTSTLQACISEASTNTKHTLTRERHTNTAHAVTRTLAVGDGKICDQVAAVQMRSVGTTACLDRSKSTPAVPRVMTRAVGVGMANVNENILIGLHTRNIACGPSRLPDPVKTRSIGVEVGDGRIHDSEGQMFVQTEPGLALYIDRMQKLLKEQQDLLTDSHPGAKHEVILQSYCVLDKQVGVPVIAQNQRSNETSKVKEKNQMELQMSAALHGSPSDDHCLRSIMKRRCTNLKFMDSMNPKSASHRGPVDFLSEGGDSENEEQKRREKREKEGSAKDKGKIPKRKERYKFSEKMLSACQTLEVHLNGSKVISNRELRSCLSTVQQEWFCVSSQKRACPQIVEDFLFACRHVSPDVLCYVANMADQNGNTALHYSVSHSNFSIVKILLAAGICNVDYQNKAGYTPIMLASLAAVEMKDDMMVVQELFSRGDVNAKASQAGQTALMLAVSHGRIDMLRALLAAGAEVNIQDDEGSTALMCAGEHGHADIVKLLLAQPGCDATLTDNDESTALSIALEAGHKDIAMLLYAHVNYSKGQTRGSPRSKTPPVARISSSD